MYLIHVRVHVHGSVHVRFHCFGCMFICLSTNSVQMCSLTVDMMKEKGLTEGAAKKLHKKLEELRYMCVLF